MSGSLRSIPTQARLTVICDSPGKLAIHLHEIRTPGADEGREAELVGAGNQD